MGSRNYKLIIYLNEKDTKSVEWKDAEFAFCIAIRRIWLDW